MISLYYENYHQNDTLYYSVLYLHLIYEYVFFQIRPYYFIHYIDRLGL